jgi:LmbE family N-acetylglucosaminyl deacetylase
MITRHINQEDGFDTSVSGTSESCWARLPRQAWSVPAGPLVVIAPHPDDESLGAGGLIHSVARSSFPVTVIALTDGEAACPEVSNLGAVRHQEQCAALQRLSPIGIRLVRLGIPDGHVDGHSKRVVEALLRADTHRATWIAPFEHDGHPDHDAAGRIARKIAHERDVFIAHYPIWAWHQGTPETFAGRTVRSFSLSPAAQRSKQQAIQSYHSQLRIRPGGAIVPAHVLPYFSRPYEVFVL